MRTRFAMSISAATALAVIAGCPSSTPEIQIPDSVNLPALGETIANNPATFRSNVGDTPAVTPGTVVDDLSGLDGCFGAALVGDEAEPALYTAYSFAGAAGTFESISFPGPITGGILASYPAIVINRGTFAVTGDGELTLTVTSQVTNFDEANNALLEDATVAETLATPEIRVIAATLDGDSLILGFENEDGGRDPITFTAFECP